MPFQLAIIRGDTAAGHHRLGSDVTVAGRQDGCQLQIKSSQVSRKHCEFFERKGHLIVKDLNSSNGTFVNGKRIEGQRVLEVGDEVTVGGVKFRVEEVGAAPTAAGPGDTAVAAAVAEPVAEPEGEDIPLDLDDTQAPAPAPDTDAEVSTDTELGEDAVAEFLMDLDLDDDDKT